MIIKHYELWKKEEYKYPVVGEFVPTMTSYIHEEADCIRPAFVVVPGGAYRMVSHTEGEIVAQKFYEKGYNAFVVTYTTNMMNVAPLGLQPLKDLSKAIVMIRKNADIFNINPEQISVCGFSAGGHLTGSLAVHHDAPAIQLDGEWEGISNRPNAVILSYPVISSGKYGHEDSFVALLGEKAKKTDKEYMSLEKQVTEKVPPIFLWHTVTDEAVPVENSYLFAKACKSNGVYYEQHIFMNGKHGMSLGDDKWAKGDYKGYYTMKQTVAAFQVLVNQGKPLPEPFSAMGTLPAGTDLFSLIEPTIQKIMGEETPDKAIAMWPDMAEIWLNKIYQ